MSSKLIVFARYPEKGRCKTRLAKTLGENTALEIYRVLLGHTLEAVRKSGFPAELRVTPDENAIDDPAWGPYSGTFRPQGEGDLGVRMALAFKEAFREGATKVVVIGTDCPGLEAEILHQAYRELDTCEAVIGPASDGGYYLLGLSRENPGLFAKIPWSTPHVFQATKTILENRNISYLLLPTLADVDTEDDFQRLRTTEPLNVIKTK